MLPADPPSTEDQHPYASRGGLKLEAALRAFALDVAGLTCADLGCSTGGFTSCLLHHGAARVFAVDTAYGELAWPLRQDPRVLVMERRNALHTAPPAEAGERGVDLVVIDLGWTRQAKALPAAICWLGAGPAVSTPPKRVITLVKPHYERPDDTAGRRRGQPKRSAMPEDEARAVVAQVLDEIAADPALGLRVSATVDSPVAGGKGGNLEVLALLERVAPA